VSSPKVTYFYPVMVQGGEEMKLGETHTVYIHDHVALIIV